MVDFYTEKHLLYEVEAAQFKKAVRGREAAALVSKLSAEDEEAPQSPPGKGTSSAGKKSRFTMRRRDSGTGGSVVTIDLTGGSASRLIDAAEKSKRGGDGGDLETNSSGGRKVCY